MKQIILSLILVMFTSPTMASHPLELVPMIEHLVSGWSEEKDPTKDVLWQELVKKAPEISLDVIAKTCQLCKASDSNQTKSEVAFSLLLLDTRSRQDVTNYSLGLRRNYLNISIKNIVDVMASVPDYQRESIYTILIRSDQGVEESLEQVVQGLLKSFSCMERATMYFYFKTSGIFSKHT